MTRAPRSTFTHTHRHGMSLVEIVVAMGIVVLFTTSFVALVGTNYGRLELARDQSEAAFLMQEAAGAVRNIAARDWTEIEAKTDDPGTAEIETNGITRSGTEYMFSGTEDVSTVSANLVFTRRVAIGTLYRSDPPETGDVIPPDEYEDYSDLAERKDADARLVTIDVAWTNEVKESTSIRSVMVVSRWSKGSILFDTLEDFAGDPAANPPQLHNAAPVKELFNGEVRMSYAGSMRTPAATALLQTGEAADPIIDIAVREDDLYVLTKTSLRHASLANISTDKNIVFDKTMTIPLASAGSAMAAGSSYVYVGTEVGSIRRVDRRAWAASSTMTWTDVPDFSNNTYNGTAAPVRRMMLTADESALLLGRDFRTDVRTYEFQVVKASDGTTVTGMEAELDGAVTGLATNGVYAYASTSTSSGPDDINVLDLTAASLRVVTTISPFSDGQSITDIALHDGSLYVTADVSATTHEFVRADMRDPESPVFSSLELGASARRVYLAPSPDWFAVVQDDSSAKIRFIRKEGPLTTLATANLSSLAPGGINLTGDACRAIAYEKDRLFFGCNPLGGAWHLVMLEDADPSPVRHADYASYVSPVKCAPVGIRFEQLAYQHSGNGMVSLQIRTGNSVAETRADTNPWNGIVFSDASAWHDLSTLGLTGNCAQIKAVYSAAPDCPLYLEHAMFTFSSP